MKIEAIKTERLILRDFEPSDFDTIHEYGSDLEVVEFMDWGPNTVEDTQNFINRQLECQNQKDRKVFELAVTLKDSGVLIGGTGITIDVDGGVLGYCFNKKYWGNGYATEVTKALMKWAEENFKINKFRATCDVLNEASRKVLEKCGFKIVKKVDNHVEVRGRWRNTYFLETT